MLAAAVIGNDQVEFCLIIKSKFIKFRLKMSNRVESCLINKSIFIEFGHNTSNRVEFCLINKSIFIEFQLKMSNRVEFQEIVSNAAKRKKEEPAKTGSPVITILLRRCCVSAG